MYNNLSTEEIEAVLHKQLIGRIGCHADGMIYVVPINYAYDGEYVYCYTQEGLKVSLMRKNPQVCFEVEAIQNMGNWQCVIAWGAFEELPVGEARKNALNELLSRIHPMVSSERTHLSADWPFTNKETESVKGIVFRIRLTKKTGRFEKSTQSVLIA